MSSSLNDKIAQNAKMKFPIDECIEMHPDMIEYKILIVGDSQVGKSSICNRFTMNEFNLEIKPTTQSDCYTKCLKIFDQYIKLYLIDVYNQEYKTKKEALYTDVKGVVIVYDITKESSFDSIESYKADIHHVIGDNVPFILLGNKCDMNTLRNVEKSFLIKKAKEFNCSYKEVNCIEQNMVKEAMKMFVGKIYYENLPQSQQDHYMNLFNSK